MTETLLSRFKREGTAIARLHHSHIVPVFGTGEQNGIHYCVLQYIEGCSLDRLISTMRRAWSGHGDSSSGDAAGSDHSDIVDSSSDKLRQVASPDNGESVSEYSSVEAMKVLLNEDHSTFTNGRAPTSETQAQQQRFPKQYWKNVARIGIDMSDALSHAHDQGVLHRDVKPGNILIDRTGHVWLADFGVAKLMDHDNLTATDGMIGTLRYTPPEQFAGTSDARSDIYSPGLTLYEMCALQQAFTARDRAELFRQITGSAPQRISRMMADIPRDLETVIAKAMAPAPTDRYQKAADLAADLRSFVAGRPVSARRLSLIERSWRWCRRHRNETALGGIIAMLLISFGVTASVAYVREADLRRQSEITARTAIAAINKVYDSYVPDWTTSSTVSAHGSISVSPQTAELLADLLSFYDELSERMTPLSGEQHMPEATIALRRVALIYHRLGMFSQLKDVYGRAIVRLSSLAQRNTEPRIQLEHARLNNEIGAVYWTNRQIAEAYESHQNAIKMLQRIESHPSSLRSEVLFEKARTEYLLGRRA